nr:MAG TPA: hypothetical protein [Caudoviricetes sp.]
MLRSPKSVEVVCVLCPSTTLLGGRSSSSLL